MNLRTRLILGYGHLVVLLLVAAGSGAVSFYWLNQTINQLASQYSRESTRAIDAYRALDRQQSSIIDAISEGEKLSADHFEESDRQISSFLESLDDVDTPEESKLTPNQMSSSFDRYRRLRNGIVQEPIESRLSDYRRQLQAPQSAVKRGLLHLFEARQDSVRDIEKRGESIAKRTGIWLGCLAVFGLISLVLISRQLEQYLFEPLSEIRDATDAVSKGGDTKRRIQIQRDDELGQLAACYNRTVDQRQELEQQMLGRLNQERQLLVGILELEAASHAVFSLNGRLIASSWEMGRSRQKGISDWIRQTGRDKLRGFESGSDERPDAVIEADDVYLKIELLSVHGVRPIGWYVRRLHQ